MIFDGRRVPNGTPLEVLRPGDYVLGFDGIWYGMTPVGTLGSFKNHTVTVHADLTISVAPSILVIGGGRAPWHGYLRNGSWEDVN